jgi:hypothetical protein
MTFRVEWPLETVRHVTAAGVARGRHRPCSLEASAAGATDEKQFAVFACADGNERLGDAIDEGCVQPIVWEPLPFKALAAC